MAYRIYPIATHTTDGYKLPAYGVWQATKARAKINGHILCEEWKDFMKFYEWYVENELDVKCCVMRLDRSNPNIGPDNMVFVPEYLRNVVNSFYRAPTITKTTPSKPNSRLFTRLDSAHKGHRALRGDTVDEVIGKVKEARIERLKGIAERLNPALAAQIEKDISDPCIYLSPSVKENTKVIDDSIVIS